MKDDFEVAGLLVPCHAAEEKARVLLNSYNDGELSSPYIAEDPTYSGALILQGEHPDYGLNPYLRMQDLGQLYYYQPELFGNLFSDVPEVREPVINAASEYGADCVGDLLLSDNELGQLPPSMKT